MMLAKLVMLKLLCALAMLSVIAVKMVGNKGGMSAASFLIIILEMVLRNDLRSQLLCHGTHGLPPPPRNSSKVIN